MPQRVGEWFRFITPVLITLVGALVGLVYKDLKQDMVDMRNGQSAITEKFSDLRERVAVTETRLGIVRR